MSPIIIIYITCTFFTVISAHIRSNMLHSKTEMEEMECIPGQRVKQGCKECFCAAGIVTNCVDQPCAKERRKVSPEDPEVISTRMMKDLPECTQKKQYFMDGCKLCYCTSIGRVGLCTPCVDPQNKVPEDELFL